MKEGRIGIEGQQDDASVVSFCPSALIVADWVCRVHVMGRLGVLSGVFVVHVYNVYKVCNDLNLPRQLQMNVSSQRTHLSRFSLLQC